LNLCPRGEPFVSQVGVVETCSSEDQCPSGHWCHQVGFASTGLCCPSPTRVLHGGICPSVFPILDNVNSCRFDCRSDGDCRITEKCCYDGCGLHCKAMSMGKGGSSEESKPELVKPGTCPYFDEEDVLQMSSHVRCYPEDVPKTSSNVRRDSEDVPKTSFNARGDSERESQCNSDDECAGVQKCCSDGCSKKCLYPESTSACVQAKSALQMIGQASKIQCRPDGSFEEVQCDAEYCWCVNEHGVEMRGTRTSDNIPPNCLGWSGATYCSLYKSEGGVCCPGREPRWSPGTCPPASSSNSDCSRHCLIDEQCSSGQRCCFNGCGLACVAAVFSTPPRQNIHIGECLNVKPLGAFCVQRAKEPECSVDVDCPPLRKCCSDGCARRCTAPDVATHCVHARLAALSIRESDSNVFVPECDANGEYSPIQAHYGLKWCVDGMGREVPGTKTVRRPNCKLPRSCPVRACDKRCLHGICCVHHWHQTVHYFRAFIIDILSVPAINVIGLPNVCPIGEPLASPGTDHLAECSGTKSCPAGYYCTQSGYEGRNFCCRGNVPPALPITCPPVPLTLNPVDSSSCVVACRRATDCPQSVCCFNGCGTSCQFETAKSLAITAQPVSVGIPVVTVVATGDPSSPNTDFRRLTSSVDGKSLLVPVSRRPVVSPVRSQKPIVTDAAPTAVASLGQPDTSSVNKGFRATAPMSAVQKIGVCPSMLLNPGCREECLTDSDCTSFSKCCKGSCGTRCVEPTITSACLHRLRAFTSEWPHLPPPVQCEPNGDFRQIQCDIRIRFSAIVPTLTKLPQMTFFHRFIANGAAWYSKAALNSEDLLKISKSSKRSKKRFAMVNYKEAQQNGVGDT
uniref:Thyroglobulin type-1 domain-containing protein n=1 Tax=Heligmosomoides polygyrus TaxID=6339 RepID=A0A8L8KNN1_HELPZ